MSTFSHIKVHFKYASTNVHAQVTMTIGRVEQSTKKGTISAKADVSQPD